MAKPKPAPKPRSKLAKAMPGFAKGFVLSAFVALGVAALLRFRLLDAWAWSAEVAPSIYAVAALVAAVACLGVASWRGGKSAFWGATVATMGALGWVVFVAPGLGAA